MIYLLVCSLRNIGNIREIVHKKLRIMISHEKNFRETAQHTATFGSHCDHFKHHRHLTEKTAVDRVVFHRDSFKPRLRAVKWGESNRDKSYTLKARLESTRLRFMSRTVIASFYGAFYIRKNAAT